MSTPQTHEETAPRDAVGPHQARAAASGARIAQRRRYLMCRSEHFTVSYRINPWMEPEKPTDTAKAVAQ